MNSSELKATAKLIEKMVGRINAKDNEIARYHGLLDQERCHRDQERNAAKETLAAVVKNREEFMEEIAALKEKCAGLAADARYHENISLSISASCDKHHTNKSSAETEIAALKQERDDLKKAIEGTDRVRSDLAASYKREIGALKAERDDLRQIVEMVHSDLGIKPGDHIGQAISYIKTQVSGWRGSYTEMERVALAFKKEVERLRSEVEPLRQESARNEAAAWNAKKGVEHLRSEVESLRAKLASRTVEWPEWAKEGTRVRVRSTRNAVTQRNFADGEEFVIEKVYYTDWAVRSPRQYWAHLSDLEPVAEHVAPPSLQVGDTVRLVRTPKTFAGSHWCNEWGQAGDHGKVLTYKNTDEVLVSCKAGADRAYWPLSCVEVVK